MKKIFLYDPRYNLKTETSYKELSKQTENSVPTLTSAKCKKKKLKGFWFIIDEKTTKDQIYEMYSNVKYKDEAWKVIEGSDDKFMVSSYGRVKRIKSDNESEFILPHYRKGNSSTLKHGLQYVKVQFKGVYREYSLARIVAYHFVDYYKEDEPIANINSIFDKLVVVHKNKLEYDNYYGNLMFTTRSGLTKINNSTVRTNPITVYDAHTGEVIQHFKSINEASKNLNIRYTTISDYLKCKKKSNVYANKYIFKYTTTFKEEEIKEIKNTQRIMNVNKPIGLINPTTGELVKTFYSIKHSVKELQTSREYIKRFLDIPPTEKGELFRNEYLFKTLNQSEVESSIFDEYDDKIKASEIIQRQSCIIAIDATTNKIIDKFPSAVQASKFLPVSDWSIRDHLKKGENAKPVKGKYLFKKIEQSRYSKPIIALDANDETFLGAFTSITEASKSLELPYDSLKNHLSKDYRKPFRNKYNFKEIF